MSETGDLLRAAAERLRGRWTKGDYTDMQGRVCALGACMAAEGDLESGVLSSEGAEDLLLVVAQEQYPQRIRADLPSVVDFNDHPDTVEAEVLAVFEKAAARADEAIR